jgi:hypothetical protein
MPVILPVGWAALIVPTAVSYNTGLTGPVPGRFRAERGAGIDRATERM